MRAPQNKNIQNLDVLMSNRKYKYKMYQDTYVLMCVAHDQMLVGHTCKCSSGCQMAAKPTQDGVAVLLQGS